MTQQRSNDEIREHVAEAVSDYCIHVGPIPPDESVCHECKRIADAVFDADVAPLLARVSELETENERLRLSASGSMLRYRREMARAERAEAQVRAVEAQRAEWGRNGEVGQCVLADVDSALAAGLSLQEEQE